MEEFVYITIGLGFIFLMNCLGSAVVFFFRKSNSIIVRTIFLGFCAGIMISAAVFGLLVPAIKEASDFTLPAWIPTSGGFIIGVLFLYLLDKLLPHLHPESNTTEGISSSIKRTSLLVSAVAIHHIPEGMAVGLSFIIAIQSGDPAIYASAIALCIGIGIQSFPEGAAISIPLKQEGFSTLKSFIFGCLSGITGPIFGLIMIVVGSLLGTIITPYMPWLLSFAAGAMMYVVIEELIPESHIGEHSNYGTISVMVGFVVMMILEIILV